MVLKFLWLNEKFSCENATKATEINFVCGLKTFFNSIYFY